MIRASRVGVRCGTGGRPAGRPFSFVGPVARRQVGLWPGLRAGLAAGVLAAVAMAAMAAVAAADVAAATGAAPVTVYRCPGPPVLFTDALSPAQALERGCVALQDQPVSAGRAGSVRLAGQTGAVAQGGPAGAAAKVRAEDQRERDAAAREILQAELSREEQRLQQARRAGDAAAVARAEADIQAIRRELARRR